MRLHPITDTYHAIIDGSPFPQVAGVGLRLDPVPGIDPRSLRFRVVYRQEPAVDQPDAPAYIPAELPNFYPTVNTTPGFVGVPDPFPAYHSPRSWGVTVRLSCWNADDGYHDGARWGWTHNIVRGVEDHHGEWEYLEGTIAIDQRPTMFYGATMTAADALAYLTTELAEGRLMISVEARYPFLLDVSTIQVFAEQVLNADVGPVTVNFSQ